MLNNLAQKQATTHLGFYRKTLVFLLLIFGVPVIAQENILLQGIVETDSIESSQINIINLTQKTGTTSSANGTFEIRVRENDTILFSAVQYQVLKVKITGDILQNKLLKVHLKILVNELEEVPISNLNLSGNLKQDLASLSVFSQAKVGFPFKEIYRPTGVAKIYASYTSSSLMKVINSINGNLARLERAGEIIKFDKVVDRGINAVSVSFFTDELKFSKNEILHFVNYCNQNEKFEKIVAGGDLLELIDFYYQQAPLFKQSITGPIIKN